MKELKYIALIPAYEPDEELKNVVGDLKKYGFIVVIVDDGSGKDYEKYLDVPADKIISYETNMGKGYALKTGYRYIKENYNNYIVVNVDCDGQHKADDAYKLCEYVKDNPNILVIGKRLRKKNVPIRSKIGNAITRFIFFTVTLRHIYDTQSGLRAFSESLMDYMMNIKGNRFEYEMNVLLYLNKNHIKHKEIEIKTIYINNNRGSHFKVFRDSFRIYKQIIKFTTKEIILFIILIMLVISLINIL